LVNHSFTQTRESGSPRVPPTVDYKRSMAPGFEIRGVYWIAQGPWGVAGRTRLYTDSIEIGTETHTIAAWTLHTGARYRGAIKPGLDWFALAEIHRLGTTVIQYANEEHTAADATAVSLVGLRVGGGIAATLDGSLPLHLTAELAETFAPAPIGTYLGVSASYPFLDMLSARIGMDLDFRSATVEVANTTAGVKDTEIVPTLGIEYMGL
jgi:hypothetical protein